jgi:hypothetical protein
MTARPRKNASMRWTLKTVRDRCDAPDGEDGCWLWRLSMRGSTPQATVERKRGANVRRWVYAASGRRLRSGWSVIATCEHERCLQPTHLKLISPSTFTKRTYQTGARPRRMTIETRLAMAAARTATRLLDPAVRTAMRERRREGATLEALAAEFDVHASTAGRVCRFETWVGDAAANGDAFGRIVVEAVRCG